MWKTAKEVLKLKHKKTNLKIGFFLILYQVRNGYSSFGLVASSCTKLASF
jgi:hypothetical protein